MNHPVPVWDKQDKDLSCFNQTKNPPFWKFTLQKKKWETIFTGKKYRKWKNQNIWASPTGNILTFYVFGMAEKQPPGQSNHTGGTVLYFLLDHLQMLPLIIALWISRPFKTVQNCSNPFLSSRIGRFPAIDTVNMLFGVVQMKWSSAFFKFGYHLDGYA